MLPYNRQLIDEDDIAAVVATLQSPWLTTGPKVAEFEEAFAKFVHTSEAVCVNSGTAALHGALHVLNLKPGDEVIVPPITFVATANAVRYVGASPVFADVEPETLCVDPRQVEAKITARTKAIIAVDYAGQPCDYDSLCAIAEKHHLVLLADACHALGGSYRGDPVGSLADLSTFSFHPVKPITTGEGGMITTNNSKWAKALRTFRNHGIDKDAREREKLGTWSYDMVELGWNYRLPDLACALGISQLKKLPTWAHQRRALASHYQKKLKSLRGIRPLSVRDGVEHGYHLMVTELIAPSLLSQRDELFNELRASGIGVHVMYRPVYQHTAYQEWYETAKSACPEAEKAIQRILILPLFVEMTESDVDHVIQVLSECLNRRLT